MTSAPDWPEDTDDWEDFDECEICGFDGLESHYHCGNCWKESSMFGHYNPDTTEFDCERKRRPC